MRFAQKGASHPLLSFIALAIKHDSDCYRFVMYFDLGLPCVVFIALAIKHVSDLGLCSHIKDRPIDTVVTVC